MSTLFKILPLFLLSMVKFVVGVPSAFAAFQFNFWELLLFAISAGFMGVTVFMFFSDWLFAVWDAFKYRFFRKKEPVKKKIFTRQSRIFVRIIKKYGLPGIALITPTIISIPIGTILARRLYPDRKKVYIYLLVSVVIWSFILSLVLHFPKILSNL